LIVLALELLEKGRFKNCQQSNISQIQPSREHLWFAALASLLHLLLLEIMQFVEDCLSLNSLKTDHAWD